MATVAEVMVRGGINISNSYQEKELRNETARGSTAGYFGGTALDKRQGAGVRLECAWGCVL